MQDTINLMLDAFIADALPLIAVIVSGYLTHAGYKILSILRRRMELQLGSVEEARTRYYAEKWVRAAESIVEGDKDLKEALGQPEKGEHKMAIALEGMSKDLPKLPEDEARNMIESVIHEIGLGSANKIVVLQEEKKS